MPTEDQQPRLLRMRICTLLAQERVRIIEVPDERGPDNRGCTVLCNGKFSRVAIFADARL